MDLVAGSVVGGKYRLDRPLARGGMGAVWAGHHLQLDVPIAVKFMEPSSDTASARMRFAREARAAASLRSPHVVQVLDYDAAGEHPYIVMELLEGEDLGHRLARRGRLSPEEVVSIVTALAAGLMLAQKDGIVHRDLKPGNIFIARVGSEEVVKILDFGVAKEIRLDAPDNQTTTGVVVGSPSYMSPEQARGGQIDHRSDLWSLAVVIFQALTGKRPFEGANLGDVLVRICSDALPVATRIQPGLPPGIDRFFERALCRSPDGRYQDARALLEGLRSAVDPTWLGDSAGGALAPRADATGAMVIGAHAAERSAAAVPAGPDPDSVATVSARSVQLSPTIEARVEPPTFVADPLPLTTAGAALSSRSRPERRGILWGLAGALGVAALWVVSRAGVLDSDATVAAGAAAMPPAPTSSAEAPRVVFDTQAAEAHTAAAPSAAASVFAPASASAMPSAVVPRAQSFQRSRPPPVTTVDPKFGLPGGRSR